MTSPVQVSRNNSDTHCTPPTSRRRLINGGPTTVPRWPDAGTAVSSARARGKRLPMAVSSTTTGNLSDRPPCTVITVPPYARRTVAAAPSRSVFQQRYQVNVVLSMDVITRNSEQYNFLAPTFFVECITGTTPMALYRSITITTRPSTVFLFRVRSIGDRGILL